jgi:hypothetical protein
MNTHSDRNVKRKKVLHLHERGKTKTEISELLGVPRSTIHDWVTDRRRNTTVVKTTVQNSFDENDNPINIITEEETTESFDAPYLAGMTKNDFHQERLKEFLENVKYVQYPAPTKPKTYSVANKSTMIIGDMHFGFECWDTINIFLQAVEELKPERIILNGDTVDLLSISKYSKDPRHTHSINDEIEAYHKFLKILHDITESFNSEILETNGNHSGNGIEGRWWRYISASDDIKQLLELPQIAENLSYTKVFHPQKEWSRIRLVDSSDDMDSLVELPNNVFVYHGDIVRKHGGFSARGNFEKHFASTITSHTHRLGSTYQTIPKIGSRPMEVIENHEIGCACKLNPTYVKGANWQNGFCIVNYTENSTGVELVKVTNKKATINSLGKTFKVD